MSLFETIANYFGYYSEYTLGTDKKGSTVSSALRGSERQKNGTIVMYREVVRHLPYAVAHPIMNATAEYADGRVQCVTDRVRQYSGPLGDFYGNKPSFRMLEFVINPDVSTLHITWRDNPENTLELVKVN